jgi:hypothetical protein
MWTSKSASCSLIASMKPGKLARSRSCFGFIVPWALMTNRKSILPSQPAGCCGPKSGMPMSHTTPSLVELVLVDDVEEVELELSAADPLDDDPAAVDSADPAVAVETFGLGHAPKTGRTGPATAGGEGARRVQGRGA